jgi:hypothetical protein
MVKKPLDKTLDKKCLALMMVCLSSGMLVLTGCEGSGGPSGPPGARPMGGPPGASRPGAGPALSARPPGVRPNPAATVGVSPVIAPPGPVRPPEKERTTPEPESEKKPEGGQLASIFKVENAGNLVNLASDLIAAGVNPFLNRLPKPLQPEAAETGQQEAQPAPQPPADPLDAIKLLGIVYNSKAPIALISVENAKYASQLVRPGDMVTLEAANATIGRITQTSIELLLTGPNKEKRTMVLPDIVGYGSSKTETSPNLQELPGNGPSSGEDKKAPHGQVKPEGKSPPSMGKGSYAAAPNKGQPPAPSDEGHSSMNGSGLSNLQRLAAKVNAGLNEH